MMWGYTNSWWGWLLMILSMVGFWALLIALVVIVVRALGPYRSGLAMAKGPIWSVRHARLHPRQGRLPAAAAQDRRAGPRRAAHDRRRPLLHRRAHPARVGDRRAAGGRAGPGRPAPAPLRRPGRPRRRTGSRRQAHRGHRRGRTAPPQPRVTT